MLLFRIFLATVILLAFFFVASTVLGPWYTRWGATDQEAQSALPGDDLVPSAALQKTWAVTVHASPSQIWPWLLQTGAGRGGLYTYSWFERLLNCPVVNSGSILPELQNPQVGDEVRLCPGEFGPPPYQVAAIQPVQLFAFGGRSASGDSWGQMLQFVIVPNEDGSVRLLLRDRTAASTAFDRIFSPGFFIMERRMLQGIGRRAEGLPAEGLFWEAELFLWLFAFFGFLLALGGILARRAWHRPALLAGFAALVTLFFAFAQPPLWIDALGVAAIYAGLAWVAFSPGRKRAPRPLQVTG